MRTLASMPLLTAADVVGARQTARRLAELLGFDRQDQTRIATAVSEIARNAATHARGGSVAFVVDLAADAPTFTVTVADKGPGIADIEDVLSGQKTFPPGQGNGLLSARRLVDAFDIEASARGTSVRLSQRMPRAAAARLTPSLLDKLSAALPHRPADPIAALNDQNRELLESLNDVQEKQAETNRLNRELEDTNRGVVALYSELEQKAEQLRSVSEMKTRFLSQISHECRTPLNSILALSRLLIDGVDGALNTEQARQVDYIRKSAQSLLEIVNDLLDLAKVEAGKLEVRPSTFSVPNLFASLRGSLRPLLTSSAVELVFEDASAVPDLYADEQKVSQVLRNFIANALKFTERGHVRVRAQHDAVRGTVLFAVEDTGIGIEPQNIEVIFEEFSQIDGRLQRGGTGLGLPLSRRLALLLGGNVSVRSRVDVGSTFELTIPVRYGEPSSAPAALSDGRRRRVLVVDDEEAFRYVIRHIASDAGYDVLEAGDGETGMRLAEAERPDAIVLDLNMPRLDGFATLARLAETPLRTVPVIVCTSQSLSVDQKRALVSAYAIVPKHDVSRDGLTALLRAVVDERATEP